MVVRGRLQVLADGDHVDVMGTQIAERLLHLFHGFAQTEHDAGFGRYPRIVGFELLQQGQGPLVVGSGTYIWVQIGHGFKIVVEHIRRRLIQQLQRAFHTALAAEVRSQDFDLYVRTETADLFDAAGEVFGTAITQIVAVYRCDDHITQLHVGDGFSQIQRFGRVRRLRATMRDIAETATACANLAQNHKGCGTVAETFMDVRAAGFFADGDQMVLAQLRFQFGDGVSGRNAHADPARFAQYRRLGKIDRTAGDFAFA